MLLIVIILLKNFLRRKVGVLFEINSVSNVPRKTINDCGINEINW